MAVCGYLCGICASLKRPEKQHSLINKQPELSGEFLCSVKGNNGMQNKQDETEIDLLHLARVLIGKFRIVCISMVIFGVLFLSYSVLFKTPQYEAAAMMYVNNSSFTAGSTSFSISSSELSAAKSLLDIYVVILKTRMTLEAVIEEADLDYTYEELDDMVSAASVNATEVFEITVESPDPAEAELIVNTIVKVLPERISDVVDGSSVRLVDRAVRPTHRSSPSYTSYALIGIVFGFAASSILILFVDLMNTKVRSESYLNDKYNIPVLAVVPDVDAGKKNSYAAEYDKEYRSAKAGSPAPEKENKL